MDFSLKKRCTDRLSSFLDELICQILSSLPTKDAAIVSLSSKNMRSAFMYLTTLDFDDSPISYCARKNPQLIKRFQIFKTFVNNVLEKSQSPHLSKFRFGFGGDLKIWAFHNCRLSIDCGKHCFPYLDASELNSWISFSLSRGGVRDIDLRIHVRKPGKMSSTVFTCETLEVLKLDKNLYFGLVSSMPSFRLPKLKVIELHSINIPEDDFVHRLVSNCPSLQELCINCRWDCGKSVVISSASLQKLVLCMNRDYGFDYPMDLLNIDTPNLQYFEYKEMLAFNYSVTSMKAPAKASIEIYNIYCDWGTSERCFLRMLNLVQALCNVQHLRLSALCLQGIEPWYGSKPDSEAIAEPERWCFRENQVSPYCCKTCLKRIVINYYRGTIWEVELLRSLLGNAPVLEELLIICEWEDDALLAKDNVDPELAESTLKKLPMASSTCLITLQ